MTEHTATDAYVTAEWIRRPLPDLGGLSPSDAAADGEGRKKLDDLLIELAGHHVRLTRLGLPAVNPDEIRKALGIEAPAAAAAARPARTFRPGPVKRNALLDELGTALTGGDVDSVAYFNTKTGAVEHFMHNLGDQENARIAQADADADLKKITPVTTDVRYGIMSDFISTVDDIAFAGKLRGAISGKGAFRRFRETVDEDDSMRRRWLAYRTKRHYHLALDWLHRLSLDPEKYQLRAADFDWEPAPVAAESAHHQRAGQHRAEKVTAAPSNGSDGAPPLTQASVGGSEGHEPLSSATEPSSASSEPASASNEPPSASNEPSSESTEPSQNSGAASFSSP